MNASNVFQSVNRKLTHRKLSHRKQSWPIRTVRSQQSDVNARLWNNLA